MPDHLDVLAASLHQQATDRETREMARLQQVLAFASHDGCQVSALCAHFDRPLDAPCGHCAWCLHDQTPMTLPDRIVAAIPPNVLHQSAALRQAHPDVLSEPYALTRFLCGVTSPWLTRAKLVSHPLFGALAHVPFQHVLSQVRGDT
jgi:ATP-dependent DNA helicase RecQ